MRPLDLGLDVELALGRLEAGGVLEVNQCSTSVLRAGEPARLGEQLVVVEHRRELGLLLDERAPSAARAGRGAPRACARRRQVEEALEDGVHQRAARGRRAGRASSLSIVRNR